MSKRPSVRGLKKLSRTPETMNMARELEGAKTAHL